jgi:methyl-accepting chemotaxis protein
VLVAVVATQAMSGLNDRTTTLGERDLRATDLSGNLAERNATIGHLVAQHLFVYDGDLKAQDALAKRMDGCRPRTRATAAPSRSRSRTATRPTR